MIEKWVNIKGYNGEYKISNLGRILSYKQYKEGRILKTTPNKKGYPKVSLIKDGSSRYFEVHRLVAMYFVPNPRHLKYVNHKDGIKTNNESSNLEWCTQSQNVMHSIYFLGNKSGGKCVRKIRCIETGKIFDSIRDAERACGIPSCNISRHLRGFHGNNVAGGFHWEYAS